MKRNFKKIISIIIVLAVIFGSAPLSGFKGVGSSLWKGLGSLSVKAKEKILDVVEHSAPENVTNNTVETTSNDSDIVEHAKPENVLDNTLASSGQCGENVYWTFDKATGKLTVTGTGEMYDVSYYVNFYHYFSPFSYSTSIKTVVIENGVTSIDGYLFYNCTGLTSVTIPDSVTSIGECTFYDCTGLTRIEIPDSVTSIGENAFNGCTGLTSIEIPDSVTSIGDGAFEWCTGLTSVTIPDSVTSIGDAAFEGCTGLTSVTLGNGVTSIGWSAFSGCNNLTSMTIPFVGQKKNENYNTHFGYIFGASSYVYNSSRVPSSLKTVIITGGDKIADYAFSGCAGLTSVTIPDSLTSIGDYAFEGCTGITSVTIPDSVTSIGCAAFYGCNNLTSMTIPFVGATKNGTSNTHFGYIFGANYYYNNSSYVPSSLKTVVITGGEKIDSYAFYNCTSITNIELPQSLTDIGVNAFYNTGFYNDSSNWDNDILYLNDVLIMAKTSLNGNCSVKEGTTRIASKAFYTCSRLTSITITDSVTKIGANAFNGCTGLISAHVTDIDAWAQIDFSNETSNPLYYAKKLYLYNYLVEDVVLSENVTKIGTYAFANCGSITSIEIPDSVTMIGTKAFYNCSSLTSTKIGNGTQSIGEFAFYYCSNLNSVSIGNSVERIDKGAFSNCTSLTSIELPKSLTTIGDNAFWKCTKLDSIEIPDSVTRIGNYAFNGCTGLNTITIPDSVTSIGENAFNGCTGLTSIEIPDSVTSISDYTFYYCTGLTSIEIPDSVTNIGEYAFAGCTGLTSIEIPDSVTSIGDGAFSGCTGLTSIEISDSVTKIGNYAFNECSNLTSVSIGNGVTSIGEFAFYYCSKLNNVSFGNKIERINKSVFSNCSSLTSIDLPKSLTIIGDNAFWKCTKLVSIDIPDSVTKIGNYAFNGCTGLNSVIIPDSVTRIGENAFKGCANLTIKCHKDSYAHKYAVDNSLNYLLFELVPEQLICEKKPTKISYELGEEFDPTGVILKVNYTNGTQRDLSIDEVTLVGFDTSSSGANKVYFSYTENDETVNSYVFTLLVDRQVRQIFIPHKPNKTHYIMGEPFEREGMQIIASYTDGTSADVTAEVRTSGFDSTTFGLKKMTVSYTYKGKTVTLQFSYEMNPKLTGLVLTHKPNKLGTYKVGEALSKEGMIITAKFSDGSTKDVTHLIRTSGYSSKQVGKQIITVSYTYGTQTKKVQFSIIMSQ